GLDVGASQPGQVVGDLQRAETLGADVGGAQLIGLPALPAGQVAGVAEAGRTGLGRGCTYRGCSHVCEASLLICPNGGEPWAGVGTCRETTSPLARSAMRTRSCGRAITRWLPGLQRAVPSTPLDERYEVVPSTLTMPLDLVPTRIPWRPGGTGPGRPDRAPPARPGSVGQDMGGAAAGGPVLVASNRGPISFSVGPNGRLSARRGGGGMVSGLLTVASQANLLWVCAALSDADRRAARAAPGGRLELDGHDEGGGAGRAVDGASAVVMLDIPAATFAAAYNAVANSTLWFVHHMLYELPRQPAFGPQFAAEWEGCRDYNRAFATALAGAAGGTSRPRTAAVVQDYHLSLVPRMLADQRPDIRIAHFSHTPWAPPDYYRVLPDAVAREVLDGILGADHAGFLCQRWADAFADCCEV